MSQDDAPKDPTAGVAGRYAQALFALAQDSNSTDKVATDLNAFGALVDANPDLQRLVKSPVFSAEEQVRAISAVLDKIGSGGLAGNFIKLVASKRRLFALADMIAAFTGLNDAAKGVTHARVTVAEALSPEHASALQDALNQAAGGKTVNIAVKVDPSIIGGVIVKLGSRMVDASLKTKLNSIRTRMKEVG